MADRRGGNSTSRTGANGNGASGSTSRNRPSGTAAPTSTPQNGPAAPDPTPGNEPSRTTTAPAVRPHNEPDRSTAPPPAPTTRIVPERFRHDGSWWESPQWITFRALYTRYIDALDGGLGLSGFSQDELFNLTDSGSHYYRTYVGNVEWLLHAGGRTERMAPFLDDDNPAQLEWQSRRGAEMGTLSNGHHWSADPSSEGSNSEGPVGSEGSGSEERGPERPPAAALEGRGSAGTAGP